MYLIRMATSAVDGSVTYRPVTGACQLSAKSLRGGTAKPRPENRVVLCIAYAAATHFSFS